MINSIPLLLSLSLCVILSTFPTTLLVVVSLSQSNFNNNNAPKQTSTPTISATNLNNSDSTLSSVIQLNHISSSNNQDNPLANRKLVKLGNNTSSSVRTFHYGNPTYLVHTRTHNQSSDLAANNGRSSDSQHQQQQQPQKKGLFEKICIGTNNRMSGQHNKTDHYQNLAERYRNCTYVIGNLEITWLEKGHDNKPVDLSFLESIREITGYLLIAYVEVERIRMPNLQIIRGRDLFKLNNGQKEEFAMLLFENELKALELPHLSEILAGSVGSFYNKNLCHIRQIDWSEILNPGYRSVFVSNNTEPECPACDNSCGTSPCWGLGPDMCQKFSKNTCSQQCSQGRCFGTLPRECCHLFCAGGCTGPKQTDCFSCKNFYDDGECIQECPSMMRYNPSKFLWEANPNGKYAFGATCVKECPEHLLRDNGACVRTCPPNKRSLNGECIPCTGPCPKNCQGVDVVHSGNIDQLVNCTIIEGSITLLDTSFTGYAEIYSNNSIGARYKAMHPSRLEVFKTLREITGYLNIQASHPDFKNLSCFRNLKVIGGRQTTEMFHTLSIIKTSLISLNMHSLKKVRAGRIIIEENRDLCFADTIDWSQINITKREDITIRNNGDSSRCRKLGLQCHNQCAQDGCWGPGADECLSCNNYKLDDYCVDNCNTTLTVGYLSYDSGNRICKKCHSECRGGCHGTEARHCWQCKNLKDGPHCVAECPSHKYNNQGICEECDKSCLDGCTGPSNRLGEGGCNACGKTVINSTNPVVAYCIRAEDFCPDGYYQEYVGTQAADSPFKAFAGKSVCRKCHHRCKKCIGMGTHVSVCECAKYVAGDQCEDSCSRDYYADDQKGRCVKCSPECNGCYGPTEADCHSCRVYRIYSDSYIPITSTQLGEPIVTIDSVKQQIKFNCTAQCPPDKPYRISESNMLDPYCSEYPLDLDNPHIVSWGSSLSFLFIFFSVGVAACVYARKCRMTKAETTKLALRLSGFDDVEPLNQSNMKPNLAPLRSIKETELRRGSILGSGFGGTVYQGFWTPEGQENKPPQPVAIKVLRDDGQSRNMNKEFLDEAYIMASVCHSNLVRLLAVCMTPKELMLVTPLMPLGCLLEYVRNHKNDIGAKNLLEWCKQIARGMEYLEERRMVHRDLALRNVLLQTPGKALISDFGLAKFLEVNQSEYHSGGGRLPIKWLAPECFSERKFTHKSDVWAFGVTVWELLTFGMKPFEQYDTKDVPLAIQTGARLEQPNYMSAEVYKVMYACWFYSPEDRPNFKSLAENFVVFARDPERYLCCGTKGIEYNVRSEQLARNSDSEEVAFEECASEMHSINERDHESQPRSALPDLISSAQNHRGGEVFVFETPWPPTDHLDTTTLQQLSTPTTANNIDLNNNTNNSNNNNNNINTANSNFTQLASRWNAGSSSSMHHTMSTMSVGQRSELPTDPDDYLLPSPHINDKPFTKFHTSRDGSSLNMLPRAPPFQRDLSKEPPHSAGLIGCITNSGGIANEEYFYSPAGLSNTSIGQRQQKDWPQSLV